MDNILVVSHRIAEPNGQNLPMEPKSPHLGSRVGFNTICDLYGFKMRLNEIFSHTIWEVT